MCDFGLTIMCTFIGIMFIATGGMLINKYLIAGVIIIIFGGLVVLSTCILAMINFIQYYKKLPELESVRLI